MSSFLAMVLFDHGLILFYVLPHIRLLFLSFAFTKLLFRRTSFIQVRQHPFLMVLENQQHPFWVPSRESIAPILNAYCSLGQQAIEPTILVLHGFSFTTACPRKYYSWQCHGATITSHCTSVDLSARFSSSSQGSFASTKHIQMVLLHPETNPDVGLSRISRYPWRPDDQSVAIYDVSVISRQSFADEYQSMAFWFQRF